MLLYIRGKSYGPSIFKHEPSLHCLKQWHFYLSKLRMNILSIQNNTMQMSFIFISVSITTIFPRKGSLVNDEMKPLIILLTIRKDNRITTRLQIRNQVNRRFIKPKRIRHSRTMLSPNRTSKLVSFLRIQVKTQKLNGHVLPQIRFSERQFITDYYCLQLLDFCFITKEQYSNIVVSQPNPVASFV